MSLILLVSIAIRVGAMVWSVVLWRRVRDWRMGFLTAMLGLMALRQLLSLQKMTASNGGGIALPGDHTELPGLAVSLLAALATHFLAQIILDRRATRETLLEREQQLRQAQKMEAFGQLAGSVAHDFNNLLTVVFANARLAAAGLPDDDPRRKQLSDIRDAGERGARLIRQLLAFSRRQPIQPRPLDPAELVGDLAGMLRQLVAPEVEVTIDANTNGLVVEADRSQLEQVLVNLVVNARDAMRDGGHVRIRVYGKSMSRADTRSTPEASPGLYAILEVSDDGEGMTPEVRERCFEPFFTTKGEYQGTGLGLATCYGVVKQSGGFIEVDTAPGDGTTIRAYLPQLPPDSQSERSVRGKHNDKGRVLVVDDDENILAAVGATLEEQGFTVVQAQTGAEAEALARESIASIRLLITNVCLPDIRGDALAAELGASRPDMRVLLMSGAVTDRERLGGHPLLEKPFSGQALGRRVRQVLGEL